MPAQIRSVALPLLVVWALFAPGLPAAAQPPPPGDAKKEEETKQRLAWAVRQIFEDRCVKCHHKSAKAVVDGKAPDLFDAADAANWSASIEYDVRNRIMPRAGDPLPYQDILAIIEWSEKDSPKWGDRPPPLDDESGSNPKGGFVSIHDTLAAILRDLASRKQHEQPTASIRYFTIANLHNNSAITPEELKLARAALSKALNSLSRASKIRVPEPVAGTNETLLAVDLDWYGWKADEHWAWIVNEYPYGIDYGESSDQALKDVATKISDETKSKVPFLRADWFVATATRPPLYHRLLNLPANIDLLDGQLLGDSFQEYFDHPLDKEGKPRLQRMATDTSLTTFQNRLVERYVLPGNKGGYYYKSYDFDPQNPRGFLLDYPLGPRSPANLKFDDRAFEHVGGEIIYSLPNGLQAYMVVDQHGRRQDEGSIKALKDPFVPPTADTPALVNGLSCIGCHKRGLNSTLFGNKDFVRQGGRFQTPAQEKVDELYVDLDQRQETKQFEAALKLTSSQIDYTSQEEPIRNVAVRFHRNLSLEDIVFELGLGKHMDDEVKALSEALQQGNFVFFADNLLPRKLGAEEREFKPRGLQRVDFGVRRGPQPSRYQLLARALGLGTPYKRIAPTRPMTARHAIAQTARDVAIVLKASLRADSITGIETLPPADEVLLEAELARQGIQMRAPAGATSRRFRLSGKRERVGRLWQITTAIHLADSNTPAIHNLEFRYDITDGRDLLAQQRITADLASKSEKQVAALSETGAGAAAGFISLENQAQSRQQSPYAIEMRDEDGKVLPLKWDGAHGLHVHISAGSRYSIRLLNRSDQDGAAHVYVDGISMFAFHKVPEDAEAPEYVLVRSQGERIIDGWFDTLTESIPFKVGTFAGQKPRIPNPQLGVISVVFSEVGMNEKDVPPSGVSGLQSGGETHLLTLAGAAPVENTVDYQPVMRKLGPPQAIITLKYLPPEMQP